MDDFIGSYSDFKRQNNFLSRFQYIQFKRFRSLNKTSEFLQFLALYNFCTPLMSLLMPIIGLIMPYFVLYFKGIRIGFKVECLVLHLVPLRSGGGGGGGGYEMRWGGARVTRAAR